MIISLNWLKKYTTIDMPMTELSELIGARLVEIERIIDLGAQYEGVVVAKVNKVYKHPNADKLNVVEIDDGGVASDRIARLENGNVQVVCGAPNVREGISVAWIMPGATVPATFNDTDPFILEARELRGVVSNGMLASGKELAINSDHTGIVELDGPFAPGTTLIEALELDDYLLDIENKSLTHRPDCFGLIGFAREVAAITGQPFKSPDWLLALEPALSDVVRIEGISNPHVSIEDPELCPRYEAVVIAGVDTRMQSPLVIQSYLKRIGIRPISAVVDVTNYLMATTGHPLHAFDYDAILRVQGNGDAPRITVRSARQQEELKLLDGRTIRMSEGDIVICAGETPIGLAGAMGGSETEVSETTNNVLLEAATFNLYNLRNTSMRHGVFSDAVTRFTKGQAPEQTAPVLASAVRMLCDIAGGQRASDVIDEYPSRSTTPQIAISVVRINQLLGSDFTLEDVKKTLINIECTITPGDDDELFVTPPYWRSDLIIAEDIAEEIGRINGFDSLSPSLPHRPYIAVTPSAFEVFKSNIRRSMVRMGANEVLTYSFVHGDLITSAHQNLSVAYKIVNSISPELQYYRLSLTPSLLDKVNANIRQGFDEFTVFEMNKVHSKELIDEHETPLPIEQPRLSAVVAVNDKAANTNYSGAPYYHAKTYADTLLSSLNIHYSLVEVPEQTDEGIRDMIAPFEPKRSALICNVRNEVMGIVGEFKRSVRKAHKLPEWCAGFEIATDTLFSARKEVSSYKALSRYPGTEQDICFKVPMATTYGQLLRVVEAELKKVHYEWRVSPVDIYKKSDENDHKQITVRISLNDHDSTITSEQANAVVGSIAEAAKIELGALKI